MMDLPLHPGEPLKRLFFALPCAPAQRKAIARWRNTLGRGAGRPVPAENFHVTMLFLGAVPVTLIPAICAAAASVRVPGRPLELTLDRLKAWRKANVLVLAPTEAPAMLGRFVYALQEALRPLGLANEYREYRPHLTLLRDWRSPEPEAAEAPEFHLRADHFVLYESHKGAYRALAQWPLKVQPAAG